MKNSNDTIGNRTRDLTACSAVPQPTARELGSAVSVNITPFVIPQFPVKLQKIYVVIIIIIIIIDFLSNKISEQFP
jgi:hypothetical protein